MIAHTYISARLMRERVAKQKAVLKVVRELLRQSDTRVMLQEVENAVRYHQIWIDNNCVRNC